VRSCLRVRQIGLNAHIDLTFRNDPNFVGRGAILHEHGIMGLRYMFNELMKTYPIDKRRFTDKRRELAVVATSLETGKPVYFLKNSYHNIIGATVASASVPYVSKPVMLDGEPFLDGGCTEKIPYEWAKMMGFEKIVVIRTRQREYRRETKPLSPIAKALYHSYPKFLTGLDYAEERYNEVCDELDRDEAAGKVFVIAPDGPVDVSKFEKDLDKLGDLYYPRLSRRRGRGPSTKKISQLRFLSAEIFFLHEFRTGCHNERFCISGAVFPVVS
jgi:predicted patatin/cPLA2 family phospholipase